MNFRAVLAALVLLVGGLPILAQRPAPRGGGMGFEPLRDPEFVPADQADFLEPGDRIVGVAQGGTAKAYPVPALGWHHFIQDRLNGLPIVPTW